MEPFLTAVAKTFDCEAFFVLVSKTQIKQLLVSLWGSIVCREKVCNRMILKNREEGGGVINWIMDRPKMARAVDSGWG